MRPAPIKSAGYALLFLTLSRVAGASDFNSLQALVKRSFTGEYSGFLMTNTRGVHVEVCGDTCSYFEWNGNSDDEKYWRFITLFELSDSPGSDVQAFLNNVKTLKLDDLIEKSYCTEKANDVLKITCNWDAYAESLHVKVGHSRYDEGQRCYAYVTDLKTMTSSDWNCSPLKAGQSPFK